jgi:hypothetical protein
MSWRDEFIGTVWALLTALAVSIVGVALVFVVALAVCVVNYRLVWDADARDAVDATEEATMDALRTGDVVAFGVASPGPGPYVAALATRTTKFHIGIVVGAHLLHYSAPDADAFYNPRHLCAVPGPNLSDARQLIHGFAQHDALVHVLRPSRTLAAEELLAQARVFCGTPYDMHFVRSFLFRDNRGRRIQCNTFVGAMFERLGMLPPSVDPVRDYRPGRILELLEAHGGFRHVTLARLRPAT